MHRTHTLPALIVAAAVAAALPTALAETLPLAMGERASVTGWITPVGDEDVFGFELFPGDTLSVAVRDAGPAVGLLSTLRLEDPNGADTGVEVRRNGTSRPSFKFVATKPGTHVLRVTGDPGGFGGADGNFTVTSSIKRAKVGKATFGDVAGGSFAFPVGVPEGATIDVKLATKKGGFDVTGLFRSSGAAEPDFTDALVLKDRRKASVKRFAPRGGTDVYELRGTYDGGSSVKCTVKVAYSKARAKGRLSDTEPRFDPLQSLFPTQGIPGTLVTVVGQNFAFDDSKPGLPVQPRFWLGGVEIPQETIEHPLDQVFRFPAPAGTTAGTPLDLRMRNPDGQGDVVRGAYLHVPVPTILALDATEAGPAGGRLLRIVGEDFRGGTVVLFDDTVVEPRFVFPPARIDVVAPPHAPGTATIRIRDEDGQVATSPVSLTYLDIGSNRIDSADPASPLGVGGETVTVTGIDFGTDSVLTLDGSPLAATRVSPTEFSFRFPAHAGGTATLRVEDDYEQSSELALTVRAFTDVSSSVVPSPLTTVGSVDGWRATRVLEGLIDDDDEPDLVIVRPAAAFGDDASRPRVRILLWRSGGFYVDGTSGIPAVSADDDWRARDAALADVDGDDDLDIVLVTTDELNGGARSSVRLLLNDGSGSFTDATDDALPGETSAGDHNQGRSIVVTDLTGDQRPEIVITNDSAFQETIDESPPLPFPPPDPLPPPVLTTYHYAATRVLVNDGQGVFTRSYDALPAVDANSVHRFEGVSVAAGEFDGNSGTDLVIVARNALADPANQGSYLRRTILLANDGSGSFTDVSASSLPAVAGAEMLQGDRVSVADANDDGTDDILLTSVSPLVDPSTATASTLTALRVLLNDGSGGFTLLASNLLPSADRADLLQCDAVAVGDLTGDGHADFVITSARAPNGGGHATRVLVWTITGYVRGEGGLPHAVLVDDGRGAEVRLVDTDRDGDLDIVIGRDEPNETNRNTRVLANPEQQQ